MGAVPWPSRAQAREGLGLDQTCAVKGWGGAASACSAAGVNPGEPTFCPPEGTQAHASVTEELFWELAGGKVIGALPGEFVLHGPARSW